MPKVSKSVFQAIMTSFESDWALKTRSIQGNIEDAMY